MTAQFDPGTDLVQIVDRLEAVTLRRADGSAAVAIVAALRRAVTTREAAASDGRYTASDVRWHFPAAELNVPPRLGDRVVDIAGQSWTIFETRLQTCGSRWECITRNLALAGGLNSFVTILREVPIKGANGAVEPTYVPLASAVAARIQELSSRRQAEHGRQSGIVEAKIYLAEQLLVDNGCRVEAADGTLYEITGYERPDSITSLFTINAIRRI